MIDTPTRERHVARKVIAVAGGVFVALFFAELSYRVIYSIRFRNPTYLGYGVTNILSYDVAAFRGYLKLDAGAYAKVYAGVQTSHGFRTEPFELKKPPNEYRVVALGESSTYNTAGSYQDSWPYVLQQKLNATPSTSGRHYRVINAGIPSQTTYGVNRLLHEEVFSMEPDAVVIYTLYNHVFYDSPALEGSGEAAGRAFRLFNGLLYGKSLIATSLIERFGQRVDLGRPNKFATYRYLLTDMVQSCRARNITVVLGKQLINPDYFPKSNVDSRTRAPGESPSQYADFLRIIDEVCQGPGCFVVDFSPWSPAVTKITKTGVDFRIDVLSDSVHLKRLGNEALADAIFATRALSEQH